MLPGKSQTYKFYADNASIEAAQFSDFGGEDTGKIGLYGAFVVAREGRRFTDPTTGARDHDRRDGRHARARASPGYRDDTLFLQDTDPQIGSDFMPYPIKVAGLTLVNYKNAGRRTNDFTGTVATPLLQAYVGDPMKIHVLSTPGSEQPHVFRAGGLSWLRDPYMPGSQEVATRGLAPYQGVDVHLIGGAGGAVRRPATSSMATTAGPSRKVACGAFFGSSRSRPATQPHPIRTLDGAACS